MSETIKRRLIDQIGDSPTFVAEGSLLSGDLETPGPLVMCGTVRGDGKIGGALRMAVTAEWHGEIHAAAAVIAGRITGKLVVAQKLYADGRRFEQIESYNPTMPPFWMGRSVVAPAG